MFLGIFSDGRNGQNLACLRTKNKPASGGQYPVPVWQLLGKYYMYQARLDGKEDLRGNTAEEWGQEKEIDAIQFSIENL